MTNITYVYINYINCTITNIVFFTLLLLLPAAVLLLMVLMLFSFLSFLNLMLFLSAVL